MPPKVPEISDYITPGMNVIEPGDKSKFGYSVPEIIFTHGDKYAGLRKLLRVLPTMVKTRQNIAKGYRSFSDNPDNSNTIATKEDIEEIKAYAFSLGIIDLGFTEVPRDYIFSNKKILFDKAIVLTMEMDKDLIGKAPKMIAGKEVWRTYHDLGVAVNKLAAFLRAKGFSSQAGAALGGETNYCRLAQKAGLGQIGKHGILISPGSGPSLRIATVYTNIENLPYTDAQEKEHSWVRNFCDSCLRCVNICPAQAIFKEDQVEENGGQHSIDYKKCAVPFSKTMGCSLCVKDCIFFKGDYEKIKSSWIKKSQR